MIQPIDSLIYALRLQLLSDAPDLSELFEIYANEARFGRQWLENELLHIKSGDEVLEVGAGMFLLACQLKREGIAITALEPVGSGFSHFYRLKELVLGYAKKHNIMPDILSCPAEALTDKCRFRLAYSLNVMEHVEDVKCVLSNVFAALIPDGCYRFICPNYHFPYETHFGIPAFGSKRLTWIMMKEKIQNAKHLNSPQDLWKSLNWITVTQVKHICRKQLGIQPRFDNGITSVYIERAMRDPIFQTRHNKIILITVKFLYTIGFLSLIRLMPPEIMPVMDCTIKQDPNYA